MNRTNKTAAAAPAPGNGPDRKPETRKPAPLPAGKAGPIRTVKAEPASLADLSAADLAELLAAAAATAKIKPARTAVPRVSLSAEALAAFDAMGWRAPRIDTHKLTEPQPRQRLNDCKGAAAYTVAIAALQAGPVTLTGLARLWLASGNEPKPICAIAQQLANRAGQPIIQKAETLALA